MSYPFTINVDLLGQDPSDYSGELPAEVLGDQGDMHVFPLSPLCFELQAQLLGNEVLVRGRIEMDLRLCCTRCAEFFSTKAADSAFLRDYEISEESQAIDLSEDLREGILLKIPGFPLCSKDCKGLCPLCGKNLNRDSCSCQVQTTDDRWSGLDPLQP